MCVDVCVCVCVCVCEKERERESRDSSLSEQHDEDDNMAEERYIDFLKSLLFYYISLFPWSFPPSPSSLFFPFSSSAFSTGFLFISFPLYKRRTIFADFTPTPHPPKKDKTKKTCLPSDVAGNKIIMVLKLWLRFFLHIYIYIYIYIYWTLY